jgi:hypothetical protein
MGILPALGGEQFDALRQQHGGLALDHGLVLQIFHNFDALGQRRLQRSQRLARQRCARLGGIALPGHGVRNVQARRIEQDLAAGGPVGRQRVLRLGTTQFIKLFTQGTGSALVFDAEFLEDLLHQVLRRRGGQPFTDARGPVTRGGSREGAAGQCVELMQVMGFGISVGHGGHSGGLRQEMAVACRHRSVCQPGIFAGFQTPTKAEAERAAQQGSAMPDVPPRQHRARRVSRRRESECRHRPGFCPSDVPSTVGSWARHSARQPDTT